MRKGFLTIFLLFFVVSLAGAQTPEIVTELTPVPSNIGKFSGKLPKPDYKIYGDGKIKFEVKTESVNLSGGKKATAVTILTNYKEMVFANIAGIETARVNFYGRVTSSDRSLDGYFEDRLDVKATLEELKDIKNKTATLRKVFDLPVGKYQILIIIKDIESGARTAKTVKFQVP